MAAIKTISTNELQDALESGEDIQVVNVLSPDKYGLGSIENSINIPLAELDTRIDELDKNQGVVTYCSGGDCTASRKAAEKLAAEGFNVRAYEGGLKEWKNAGLPLEHGEEEYPSDNPDAASGLSGLPSSRRS